MDEQVNNYPPDLRALHQLSMSLPQEVFEQIEQESIQGSMPITEPLEDQEAAIGRTMFDLPNSEDNTLTVLLPKDNVHDAPSQALLRILSSHDNTHDRHSYLAIVVQGPFAEPDGLRGDAPIMITSALPEQSVLVHLQGAGGGRGFFGEIRTPRDDVHAKRLGVTGDLPPDIAESQHTQCLPEQLEADG